LAGFPNRPLKRKFQASNASAEIGVNLMQPSHSAIRPSLRLLARGLNRLEGRTNFNSTIPYYEPIGKARRQGWNGAFADAIGLARDGSKFGMGKLSQGYSMIVNDGIVEQLNVEGPGEYRASSAEQLLEQA